MKLSVGELAVQIHGTLNLGSLPPLAGPFEPVRRIVVESRLARPGDVYWGLVTPSLNGAQLAEDAFLRGALGAIVSGRHVEPWAGKFSIQVPDANLALAELAAKRSEKRPRGTLKNSESADSTDLVQAMLAGYAVTLETVLERITRSLASYVA